MNFSLLKRWFWPSPSDAVNRHFPRRSVGMYVYDDSGFVRGAARLLIGPVNVALDMPSKLSDVINIGTLNPVYPWIDLGNTDFMDPNWVCPEIHWPL